jgi:TPR repeat protein
MAIELKNTYSMVNSADISLKGVVIEKNTKEAIRLYRIAIKSQNAIAMNNYGWIYQYEQGKKKNIL